MSARGGKKEKVTLEKKFYVRRKNLCSRVFQVRVA